MDDRIGKLILVKSKGLPDDVKLGFQVGLGEGRIGWVAEHKVSMDVDDYIRELERMPGGNGNGHGGGSSGEGSGG